MPLRVDISDSKYGKPSHPHVQSSPKALASEARSSLARAVSHSLETAQLDGHWVGELRSNATITAEYVFLRQALGIDLKVDTEALSGWLLSTQNEDGSWAIAPFYPGDISTTTEAYLALKILGVSADDLAMLRARDFIILHGGIAKVRIFTRIYLATFGLVPWDAVPEMPAELILMPARAPINVYMISSWARSTIVPLLLICHHRPVYDLPGGNADFLDELWYCSPAYSIIPYAPPLWEICKNDFVTFAFALVDKALYFVGGLRRAPTRTYARRKCMEWILEHQEDSGDWAGIFPPMHLGLLALTLEGYTLEDPRVRRGLEAVERFAWQDQVGKRIQACVSPVWDTALSTIALCDAQVPCSSPSMISAISWLRAHQLLGPQGDWRIYSTQPTAGGFSFEYHNSWYPDIDDTAAVVIAFLKQDPQSASSTHVSRAVEWILDMQNSDGGWAAFDKGNDKLFMNKIPFSDMDSLCDPSTADVTGRTLEAFGLLAHIARKNFVVPELLGRTQAASDSAIAFLAAQQETNGAWYGRWGVNYVYGTSNVLCGLAHHSHNPHTQRLVIPAMRWLRSVQNLDGGWGEGLDTYKLPERAGRGTSTASQTAWGLMGLIAGNGGNVGDESVEKAAQWLIAHQIIEAQSPGKDDGAGKRETGTWEEERYTGTGFPGHFYLSYDLYRHYFPIMALGRYVHGLEDKKHTLGVS